MKKRSKSWYWRPATMIALGCLAFSHTQAQTGPGGVGNSTNNRLWLKANAGVYKDAGVTAATNNNSVHSWVDQSGTSIAIEQSIATHQPTFIANGLNGYPVVRFDGSNDWMSNTINGGSIKDDVTMLVVGKFSLVNQPAGNSDYLICVGGGYGVAEANFSLSRIAGNYSAGGDRYFSYTGRLVKLGPVIPGNQWQLYTDTYFQTSPFHAGRVDGSTVSVDGFNRAINTNGLVELGRHTQGNNHFLEGEIAEIIIFESLLNATEMALVENYLAAKYDLAISQDLFAYEQAHGNEVFGIGQATGGSAILAGQGSGIVAVSNPSDLSDGEFLMVGHDQQATMFNNTDIPSSLGSDASRMVRSWRVDEQGDLGTVDLVFDLSNVTVSNPIGLELLIDDDGVFASGASSHVTGRIWDHNTKQLTFTNVNMAIGNYFTLGMRQSHAASASLEKKPSGGYYTVEVGSPLAFKYDEPYHDVDEVLSFQVLNDDQITSTPNYHSLFPQTVHQGTNWFELDMSSLNKNEHYTLVVTNEKKESKYLRFFLAP